MGKADWIEPSHTARARELADRDGGVTYEELKKEFGINQMKARQLREAADLVKVEASWPEVYRPSTGPTSTTNPTGPVAAISSVSSHLAIISVAINQIVVDPEVQQRDGGLSQETVEEYAELLRNGVKLPPVIIFEDALTKERVLADGFHREAAHRLAEFAAIDAVVRPGDRRAAILHAAGANNEHGRRRTNRDKRKAATTLLTDDEWKGLSDHKIADLCKVTQPFVSKLRKELTDNDYQPPSVTTVAASQGPFSPVKAEDASEPSEAKAEEDKSGISNEILEEGEGDAGGEAEADGEDDDEDDDEDDPTELECEELEALEEEDDEEGDGSSENDDVENVGHVEDELVQAVAKDPLALVRTFESRLRLLADLCKGSLRPALEQGMVEVPAPLAAKIFTSFDLINAAIVKFKALKSPAAEAGSGSA